LAFLTQNKAKLCKNLITALAFEKNANFFAKNCRKSQKIVIITLTPGSNRGFKSARSKPPRLSLQRKKKGGRRKICRVGIIREINKEKVKEKG
jgi:hypothetical protein